MLKQSNHSLGLGNNASQKPSDTPDILTAFNTWMENSPEHVNLRFQYGSKLFMRENGEFVIQAIRLAFEAFKYGIFFNGSDDTNRG